MAEKKKVIFRKVRGRVVPIKIDRGQTALGMGEVVFGGMGAYAMAKAAGKKAKKARYEKLKGFNMARNIARYRKPGMPGFEDSVLTSNRFKKVGAFLKDSSRRSLMMAGLFGAAAVSSGLGEIRSGTGRKQNRFADISVGATIGTSIAGYGLLAGVNPKLRFLTKVRGGMMISRKTAKQVKSAINKIMPKRRR